MFNIFLTAATLENEPPRRSDKNKLLPISLILSASAACIGLISIVERDPYLGTAASGAAIFSAVSLFSYFSHQPNSHPETKILENYINDHLDVSVLASDDPFAEFINSHLDLN